MTTATWTGERWNVASWRRFRAALEDHALREYSSVLDQLLEANGPDRDLDAIIVWASLLLEDSPAAEAYLEQLRDETRVRLQGPAASLASIFTTLHTTWLAFGDEADENLCSWFPTEATGNPRGQRTVRRYHKRKRRIPGAKRPDALAGQGGGAAIGGDANGQPTGRHAPPSDGQGETKGKRATATGSHGPAKGSQAVAKPGQATVKGEPSRANP